ncbi:MAG: hypothetical protein M1837_003697 [Sclerophora amabilis]|nr:MAG: hypothetical protein M1837_003697 [Sclerophora amabilis]
MKPPVVPPADLQWESFSACLKSSDRVLSLLGAGLSASSGLATFRGAGGLWRNHDAMSLATPEAFNADPALVWRFYSYRRHMALQAKPNRAHRALAELAIRKPEFVTLSQNVDGLSQRAGHPLSKLHLLHGSLFDIKCTSFYCDYVEQDNFQDPIVPALAIPKSGFDPTPSVTDKSGLEATASLGNAMTAGQATDQAGQGSKAAEADISNADVPVADLQIRDLPHCPKCREGLLRPAVVWFGESLPDKTISAVERWISESSKIDLILVIGTSSKVYPAAGYVDIARAKGAKVAVVNMDRSDAPGGPQGLSKADWFFEGDAGVIVPEILKSVIGDAY